MGDAFSPTGWPELHDLFNNIETNDASRNHAQNTTEFVFFCILIIFSKEFKIQLI